MSELLKKYESIDQSKLKEAFVKVLDRVKKLTNDFTTEDKKNNEIAEQVLDSVMQKNPDAIKIVKREPKAKPAPKKTHKATHTDKATPKATSAPVAKNSDNNIMTVAKQIQKAGESWKDAMERAKVVLKERKEKVVEKQKTELEKLYALVKTKKELQGFANSDIKRDAVREAKVKGARFVTKEGSTSNAYGTFPNKIGRKYWETRDRHADRLAPNYPKDMPLLASGGAVSDAPFSVEVFKTKLRFDNELTSSSKGDFPTFAKAKEFAIDKIDEGNYYAYIMNKSGNLWGVSSKGVEQFADGGSFAPNVSGGTSFIDNTYFADGVAIKNLPKDSVSKKVKYWSGNVQTSENDLTDNIDNLGNYMDKIKLWSNPFINYRSACLGFNFKGTQQQLKEKLIKLSEEMKKYKISGKLQDLYNDNSEDDYEYNNGEDLAWNVLIKDWYTKTYPTDDLGEEIDSKNNFKDVWLALHQGTNVYDVLGVGDSVVRERVFEELSKIFEVDYDYVYKKWLDSDDYAKGGELKSVVDALFEFNEKRGKLNTSFGAKTKEGITALIENKNYSSEEIAKAIFYSNNKKEKISTGYGDKSFFGLQDMIERARGKEYVDGGSVSNERMFNFLSDDLLKLEEAIKDGDFEEVNRFFSYWLGSSGHLTSLETKTNERIYSFLKEDLEKLEVAVENNDTEEVERFFSYWGQHLESLKMANGGSLPFMTDPNFGNFQNTGSFELGGVAHGKNYRNDFVYAKEFFEEDGLGESYVKNGSFDAELFKIKMLERLENRNARPESIIKIWSRNLGINPSKYIDGEIIEDVEFAKDSTERAKKLFEVHKSSFELGGAFMMTDLAGHTGGSDGLGNPMPLSGVSGTHYTGLVGETGAMSSGELFMDGGAMAQNQQVIDGASQPYVITEAFGNPAQHLAKGGTIVNQYEGKYYGDIWDNEWNEDQKHHFLTDHKNEIGFEEVLNGESTLKRATKRLKTSQGNDAGFQLVNVEKLINTKSSELPRYVKFSFEKHIREGQYASGGSLGKALYVEYSSWFTSNKYDEEKIMSVLKSIGAKNIRLEKDNGMFNQPEVVVFNGDKNKAVDALNEAFDTEYIRVSEKDWRTKKMADGGFTPDVSDGTQFMSGVYADGGSVEEGDRVTITTNSLGKDYVGMSGTITSRKLLNNLYSVKLSNGLEMAFAKDEFKHDSINPTAFEFIEELPKPTSNTHKND